MSVPTTIVETILPCGSQNEAWRDHRDDEEHHDDTLSNNCGNCRAFLGYRINGGDEDLKGHCERAPRNATYKSKTTHTSLGTLYSK